MNYLGFYRRLEARRLRNAAARRRAVPIPTRPTTAQLEAERMLRHPILVTRDDRTGALPPSIRSVVQV